MKNLSKNAAVLIGLSVFILIDYKTAQKPMLQPSIYIGIFPKEIKPKGLSLERKAYLYKELRKFCRPEDADLTAPKP